LFNLPRPSAIGAAACHAVLRPRHVCVRRLADEARTRTHRSTTQRPEAELLKYDSDGNGRVDTWSYMDGARVVRIRNRQRRRWPDRSLGILRRHQKLQQDRHVTRAERQGRRVSFRHVWSSTSMRTTERCLAETTDASSLPFCARDVPIFCSFCWRRNIPNDRIWPLFVLSISIRTPRAPHPYKLRYRPCHCRRSRTSEASAYPVAVSYSAGVIRVRACPRAGARTHARRRKTAMAAAAPTRARLGRLEQRELRLLTYSRGDCEV